MAKANVTRERLHSMVHYEPATGVFTWKVERNQYSGPGVVAGTRKPAGYIEIAIDRKLYKAHRLAWFYVHGAWPLGHIDHINGIRDDNRIANLRDVDRVTNAQNRRAPAGASWCKASRKWLAQVYVGGKNHHLGRFDSREDAYNAYVNAKRLLHPGSTI